MTDFAHDHRYRNGNGWRIVLLNGKLKILKFVDGESSFISDPEEAALYLTQVITSLRVVRDKVVQTAELARQKRCESRLDRKAQSLRRRLRQ